MDIDIDIDIDVDVDVDVEVDVDVDIYSHSLYAYAYIPRTWQIRPWDVLAASKLAEQTNTRSAKHQTQTSVCCRALRTPR